MEAEAEVVSAIPLPAGHVSLARGVPVAEPGTLSVLGAHGGVVVTPEGLDLVTFGRNRQAVVVPVGEDDRRVSRRHGVLEHRDGAWRLHATGKVPIRLPDSRLLFAGEPPVVLATGYTPLFVRGSGGREYVLEVHVAGTGLVAPPPGAFLSSRERLVFTVLGQRYLRHEPRPWPLTWRETADRLRELRPGACWTPEEVESLTAATRARLHPPGADGMDRLLRELLATAALVPPDLGLLDGEPG
ncbi:FHA domain-containing protein [Amycolatopsis sp. H20-H5]|uniref:FHA domain-containing protein n=1 Tax=Amycolatopsis sp. H20-H5 TaxID=3046309 RepID=UPI002DB67CF3|nr:FHA domain-containing protein [Amycolatopsis sp. H20-H5]MEC3982266.1 FHA domain-containing protein [Amycolatopsis sp. H20-H5]